MDKPYDKGLKRLLVIRAHMLLKWLSSGTIYFADAFSEEFQSVTIEADAMLETFSDGQRLLTHIEFQSGPDANMAQRLLEYSVLAYRRYECPIVSYVIYLKKKGRPPQPPLIRTLPNGEETLRFNYKVIEVYAVPYQELMDAELYPLVPLALGGDRREVIEEIIERLTPAHDTITKELLALSYLFAGLALDSSEDQRWLDRRFNMLDDLLQESSSYQYILQRGREEERLERLASSRQVIVNLVQGQFPDLEKLAVKQVASIEQPETLDNLIVKVGLSRTANEVKKLLLELDTSQE